MSWYEQPGSPPPGWYPDPGGHGQRWWDGARWTEEHTAPQQPPPQQPPSQAEPRSGSAAITSTPPEFWIVPAGLVLLVAGAIAPWMTIEVSGFGESATTNVGGIRGDAPGLLALLAGLAASGLLALWLAERVVLLPVVAAIVSSVAALVAIYHVADPATGADVRDGVQVGVGWGVWVTLVAALALVGSSVALAVRTRTDDLSPTGTAH